MRRKKAPPLNLPDLAGSDGGNGASYTDEDGNFFATGGGGGAPAGPMMGQGGSAVDIVVQQPNGQKVVIGGGQGGYNPGLAPDNYALLVALREYYRDINNLPPFLPGIWPSVEWLNSELRRLGLSFKVTSTSPLSLVHPNGLPDPPWLRPGQGK